MSAIDPFSLIQVLPGTDPVQVEAQTPMVVMPLELEAVVDETIQMLCEKLAAAEESVTYHQADTKRLLWLESRLAQVDYRISDDLFGNSDWTSLRDTIDAAMAKGI